MAKKSVKRVLGVFGDAAGCGIQFGGCPCNSCFHSLSEDIDWRHVSWLLLLYMRDDYADIEEDLLNALKQELKDGVEKELDKPRKKKKR